MPRFVIRPWHVAAVLLLLLAIASCGGRSSQDDATSGQSSDGEETFFEVDPEQLGPEYRNEALGLTFSPPVQWVMLEGEQRRSVLAALEAQDDNGPYSLSVKDVFFDTDSLSFLSVSNVTMTEGTPNAGSYAESFAADLGLEADQSDSNALVARMDFVVNDTAIVQFRHVQTDRITFTLILTGGDGSLVQMDYSIPTEAYNREAIKLESSIGTVKIGAAQ